MSRPDQVKPQITALYGIPIPTKRRALVISQGQSATVTFQFLDQQGNPVNLTPYGDCGPQGPQGDVGPQGPQDCDVYVEVRIKEVITINWQDMVKVQCQVVDPVNGIVIFTPPPVIANNAGVYTAEFGVFKPSFSMLKYGSDSGPVLAFTNKCYIWVDRGLFGDPKYPNFGPPTLDEIRLFIRDNGPEENFLIDDFEFDIAEVCQGAENAVRYWNEVNPPLPITFTTITYCVRHKWLQAIAAHMMIVAAYRFRRNQLPYQAGGISVDDQNKFQQYDQIGLMLMQEYKEWVKTKKVQINCEMAITSNGSAYGAVAYQILNTGV